MAYISLRKLAISQAKAKVIIDKRSVAGIFLDLTAY